MNKNGRRGRRHSRRIRWDRILIVFLAPLVALRIVLLGFEADQKEFEAKAKTCCAPYVRTTSKVVETDTRVVNTTTTAVEKTTTTSNLVYSARLGRNMTEKEVFLLTMICCSEAGFESFEGKMAVVATVLNRMEPENTSYPNDVYGVIFQPHQFSSATDGVFHTSTSELKWDDLSEEMKSDARKAVEAALNGADPTKKITGGALFFYNPDYCSVEENAKRANISCKQRIGNHVFYRVWN